MNATIYHNPRCGTSRSVLEKLKEAGLTVRIVEYLKTPPDRATLLELGDSTGSGLRGLLRTKEPLCAELGLDAPGVTDHALADAMLAHPILINRPIVVTSQGARLCRPAAVVDEILPQR